MSAISVTPARDRTRKLAAAGFATLAVLGLRLPRRLLRVLTVHADVLARPEQLGQRERLGQRK